MGSSPTQFNISIHSTVSSPQIDNMAEKRVPMTMRDFFFDDPFFKSSWEDFDKLREKMFEESRDMWKKFDQDFRDMACMSNNRMTSSSSESRSERKTSSETRKSSSEEKSSSLLDKSDFRDMDLFKEKDSEVIRVKNDDKKMEVSLDTSQYRPDELNVSIADGAVTIQGKHEEKAEDGTKMVSRQFVRKYTLPAGAKPEDVVSNLSSDGVLVVTANKANPAITN